MGQGVAPEQVDPQDRRDEANRLWAHFLHEDDHVIQRGNFYLITESMILVAYSLLRTGDHPPAGAARVIAAFGLLLTAAWVYGGARQLRYFNGIRTRVMATLPEYQETWSATATRRRGLSSTALLVYGVPGTTALIWTILLFI